MKKIAAPILCLLALQGCATLIEGSNQSISVSTLPAGASCAIDRNGERLGMIGVTPGNLTISKSKRDLTITCQKDGYQTASITQTSKFVGTTFGNIIAGGIVGIAVDATSGANFTYPKETSVALSPSAPAAPAMPGAPGPAPAVLPSTRNLGS